MILDVNFLDNKFYSIIVGEMGEFFDAHEFKDNGGIYANETKAFKVDYNEDKKVFELYSADVAEGEVGEFKVISTYLFDEGHNEKDAVSVGIDFADIARKALGVKGGRKKAGETELPTANTVSVTVTTLTAKLLAIYPELKETYKEETAEKGKFLYLDFYTSYFVTAVRKTLDEAGKKNVKKLIDMLCEMFVSGDKATSTLVVVLLSAAIGKDAERFKTATERMEECPHLITAVNNQIAVLAKDKKFQKAMKFED